jgi:hypothetical protein
MSMEPEELDPSRVQGWFVVEAGRRQAWPFLTFADPGTGREVRLYVDSTFSVTPGFDSVRQHDDSALLALDALDGETVTTVATTSQGLEVDFGGFQLRIDGRGNNLTSHSPWWFGQQVP